jgi:hypothetical protein
MGNDRLHPETLHTLRQLVKLHGAAALIEAIQQIEREQHAARTTR